MAAKKPQATIEVEPLDVVEATFYLIGNTPMILNSFSAKARRELLFPAGKKTAAQKKSMPKHLPVKEFEDAIPMIEDDAAPTQVGFQSAGFKRAMATAALEIPGTTKTSIGRLVRVPGFMTPIYGVPRIYTSMVRSADMNRTPDMRTRAILPEWACVLKIAFASPMLNKTTITNLLSAAGQIVGVGDGRQEKGALDFGLFRLTKETDKDFQRIVKSGGRLQQQEAIKTPEAYDRETAELLEWYETEFVARGFAD